MTKERCRFCTKTLGQCTCDENALGIYFNEAKDREDPYG